MTSHAPGAFLRLLTLTLVAVAAGFGAAAAPASAIPAGDPIDPATDVLDQVRLRSFTAQPAQIGPFGAARLRWAVDGPHGHWRLALGTQLVGRSGSLIVEPRRTRSYTLVAFALRTRRTLGTVTVRVDRTRCTIRPLDGLDDFVERLLELRVGSEPSLYFRDGTRPHVDFGPGGVRFRLRLAKRVGGLPDPKIDVDGRFRLDVDHGRFVARDRTVEVDVDLPWWVRWPPPVKRALAATERKLRATTTDGLDELVGAIEQRFPASAGMRRQDVLTGHTGVRVVECPAP